mgnify:CR=1 FL=1
MCGYGYGYALLRSTIYERYKILIVQVLHKAHVEVIAPKGMEL